MFQKPPSPRRIKKQQASSPPPTPESSPDSPCDSNLAAKQLQPSNPSPTKQQRSSKPPFESLNSLIREVSHSHSQIKQLQEGLDQLSLELELSRESQQKTRQEHIKSVQTCSALRQDLQVYFFLLFLTFPGSKRYSLSADQQPQTTTSPFYCSTRINLPCSSLSDLTSTSQNQNQANSRVNFTLTPESSTNLSLLLSSTQSDLATANRRINSLESSLSTSRDLSRQATNLQSTLSKQQELIRSLERENESLASALEESNRVFRDISDDTHPPSHNNLADDVGERLDGFIEYADYTKSWLIHSRKQINENRMIQVAIPLQEKPCMIDSSLQTQPPDSLPSETDSPLKPMETRIKQRSRAFSMRQFAFATVGGAGVVVSGILSYAAAELYSVLTEDDEDAWARPT